MILDETYRDSTQYRQWSYTKESLAQIRQNTNDVASKRLKAACRIARAVETTQSAGDEESIPSGRAGIPTTDLDIQTLTVDEELKIVEWGCMKIIEISGAMDPRIPSSTAATAVQYLRRFYLTNSPMTYHPRQLIVCALYLATKADHFYLPLSKFLDGFKDVSAENVKAPEFILLQGLRFALDVRHPMKGLSGGLVEMHVMADEGRLGDIAKGPESAGRIDGAAEQAKKLLMTAAQMTDAYFLYTPSQIWLAAMMVSDRELVHTYLEHKLVDLASSAGVTADWKTKLMATISACAQLLESYCPPGESSQRKVLSRIRKKLDVLQKLEKTDTVAVAGVDSATGGREDESNPDRPVKKRRVEGERHV